jgi:hypothetical protein
VDRFDLLCFGPNLFHPRDQMIKVTKEQKEVGMKFADALWDLFYQFGEARTVDMFCAGIELIKIQENKEDFLNFLSGGANDKP